LSTPNNEISILGNPVADSLSSFLGWVIRESRDAASAYASSNVHLHDLLRKDNPYA